MTRQIGRLTLAFALIAAGIIFMVDNLYGTHLAWYIGRLWPALLVVLGLEWVVAAQRHSDARPDGGALVILVIIAIVAANVGANWRAPWRTTWTGVQVEVPIISDLPDLPALPPIPALPLLPRLSGAGDVKGEVVLGHEDPAATLTDLDLRTTAGDVVVESGNQFRVELRVTAWGRDQRDAEEQARQVQLRVDSGTVTRVSAQLPNNANRIALSWRVQVPLGTNVKVDSSSGAVTVSGVDRDVNIQNSSGTSTVTHAGGAVTVTSTSGTVRITDVAGRVRAAVTSGHVTVENPAGAVSAQTSSGLIDVTAAKVGGDYDLTAVSGNVTVRIPATAGVNVSARATSGTVAGPAWLTIGEGRGSGSGTQGGGEYKLTIRTNSGSIRLDER